MKSLKFSLPDDLRAQLKATAEQRDTSEARIIRAALRAYLEPKEKAA